MTVEVNVEPEETPPPDDAPDVVVVDTGDSGDSGGEVDAVLVEETVDLAAAVGALSERISHLEAATAEAQVSADVAESTADLALDIATEPVVEEAVTVDDPEDDDPPQKVHFMHRSFGELFRKS